MYVITFDLTPPQKKKKIVTEEAENKPESNTEDDITDEDIAKAIRDLKHLQDNGKTSEGKWTHAE